MKKLSTILKPTVLKEDAENACEDAMSCLNEIITMSQNLMEGLQDVSEDLDENMMNCISETRDKIKDACECALEAYGFDACCETCKDDEEEVEEEKESDEEDMGISKDDETKFHKKLDDLVHSTFGKRMDEAKTIDAPEEKGLNDYVMPKSVIKMIAKQQFSQVKTKSKLFDTVAMLDKTKDLVHLFTSKKHKNILLGMFKIGKKASFFIHDTESSKANKLDNVGRYKDTKGFSDALSTLFEKKKEDSVKKK